MLKLVFMRVNPLILLLGSAALTLSPDAAEAQSASSSSADVPLATAPSATTHSFAKIKLTPKQSARLAALIAEADKIDAYKDPRGYLAGYAPVIAYGRTLYPDPHPELEKMKREISMGKYLLGELEGSEAAAEQAIAVFEAAGPAYRGDFIAAISNLAVFSDALGHSEKSLAQMERAIAMWREDAPPGGNMPLGQGLGNLAWAFRSKGKYEAALPPALEAIAILERLHSEKPADSNLTEALTVALSNHSMYLSDLGRKAEAADAVRSLVARLDRLVGANSPAAINILRNGSIYILNEGKFSEAEAMARRTIEISEKTLGKDAGTSAEARLTLISILTAQGRNAEALPLAEYAYKVLNEKSGPNARNTLEARGKIARMAYALGDTDRGITEFQAMLAQIEAKRAPGHKDVTENQDFLAVMLAKAGRWEQAAAVLAKVERGRAGSAGEQTSGAAAAQALQALTEAKTGKRDLALARLDRILPGLYEFQAKEIKQEGARGNRSVSLNRAFGWAALAASEAGDKARAFALAQRYQLGPSDRAVLRVRSRDRAANPQMAALLREEQDLIEKRGKAQSAFDKAATASDAPAARLAKADMDALTIRISAMQAGHSQAGQGGDLFESVELAAVQKRLRKDEAIFLSLETELSTQIFAISAQEVAVVDAAASTSRIRDLVSITRQQLDWGQGTDEPFDMAATDELAAALFTPAVERVLAGKRLVNVIAKGELAKLPFAILSRTRANGSHQWAVERFAFSYPVGFGGFGADEANINKARSKQRFASFVGVGAPALPELASGGSSVARLRSFRGATNGTKIAELGALGMASAEMTGMANALHAKQTRILAGVEATEADLRALDLSGADIIAFATHGLMAGDLDDLDEAALVLSPSREQGAPGSGERTTDDGLLTTTEIAALNLNARLVVLSACNSASGDQANGEALGGLAHAFLYAGADSLMVSHWRVRDDVAARLTVETAKGTSAGLKPAEALRRAQIALTHDRSVSGSANPALWAPFVLVGK